MSGGKTEADLFRMVAVRGARGLDDESRALVVRTHEKGRETDFYARAPGAATRADLLEEVGVFAAGNGYVRRPSSVPTPYRDLSDWISLAEDTTVGDLKTQVDALFGMPAGDLAQSDGFKEQWGRFADTIMANAVKRGPLWTDQQSVAVSYMGQYFDKLKKKLKSVAGKDAWDLIQAAVPKK